MGPWDSADAYNALRFFVQQMINSVHVATLVKVVAVRDNTGATGAAPGAVAPSGYVDVTPLVNDIDGEGNPTQHGVVHNLPYIRLQGALSAVICDPQEGDIGVAVFCDRDVSSVKKNVALDDPRSNPGSRRRNSMSDGVYVGLVLGKTPNQYITFQQGGITVLDVNGNTVVLSKAGVTINDDNGNTVVLSKSGIVLTDDNKNTVTMDSSGIVAKDLSKNVFSMSPAGVTATDLFGNSLSLSASGIALNDVINHETWRSSGGVLTITATQVIFTGILTVQGAIQGESTVTAGFGGADSVGLQTHDHSGVTAGSGTTGAPVAGT